MDTEIFPEDMLVEICLNLEIKDLASFFRVCRSFFLVKERDDFWKKVGRRKRFNFAKIKRPRPRNRGEIAEIIMKEVIGRLKKILDDTLTRDKRHHNFHVEGEHGFYCDGDGQEMFCEKSGVKNYIFNRHMNPGEFYVKCSKCAKQIFIPVKVSKWDKGKCFFLGWCHKCQLCFGCQRTTITRRSRRHDIFNIQQYLITESHKRSSLVECVEKRDRYRTKGHSNNSNKCITCGQLK